MRESVKRGLAVLLDELAFGGAATRSIRPDPAELAVGLIPWRNRWPALALPDDVGAQGVEVPAALREVGRGAIDADAPPTRASAPAPPSSRATATRPMRS